MSTPEGTTLLIDGDVIAFRAACSVQNIQEDEWGFVQPFANRHEGEAVVDNIIMGLLMDFDHAGFMVFLSDPKANWRRDVWPAYKANRTGPRPLLLDLLKGYLRRKYHAEHWAELEADDVLGILSTEPGSEKRILIGKDKDFYTIPGFYHVMGDKDGRGKPRVQEVTPWEAQRFHIWQTLAGDAVDGYPGCPGIGKTRASALLENPVRLRATEGVITRGVNKGNSTTRWVSEPTTDLWAMVVSHYLKAGLGEEEALLTARLANILHHDQYNRDTQEITLWTPERLTQL